jgi:hypothetical protein
MRLVVLGLVAAGLTACDPVRSRAVMIVPGPSTAADSVRQAAFALAGRLAAKQGLHPAEPSTPGDLAEGWVECFVGEGHSLSVCGKVIGQDVHFRIMRSMRLRMGARGAALEQELIDSLRVAFPNASIRECQWQSLTDPSKSGCGRE